MPSRLTTAKFIERATNVHGSLYGYDLVDYKTNKKKVDIICKYHGTFSQRPFSHLDGEGCRTCFDERQAMPFNKFIEVAFDVHGGKYIYETTSYNNSKIPMTIICEKHGEFKQAPYAHLRGQNCPSCQESKGELAITKILDNAGIDYIRQWTDHKIPKAHNGKKMSFDFYIPSLLMAIEYDGEQHFKPIKCFGGTKKFESIQNRDRIKDLYCANNNIKLVRISYTDNIEEIMEVVL